ncbi:hypothetical protein E2C01_087771 [Portunus trituberculatus]|uniref:Uncharacterized protein n=1 Tax=Portunus trituberculatus TaxID=210409 RepID=A0A5B7JI60_PORTR|nr:hypothetical protein [Portunus trituberculatus]
MSFFPTRYSNNIPPSTLVYAVPGLYKNSSTIISVTKEDITWRPTVRRHHSLHWPCALSRPHPRRDTNNPISHTAGGRG